jgi:CheY-like chemotaxis protein
MSRSPVDVMPARILVVDDERQIHASIKLRLGRDYEIVSVYDAREALERVRHEKFDLCLADIHMPHLDGLTFIEQARQRDPELGYVILSAFDSAENLRRAIPLQIYEFLDKPLPERAGFEQRVPEWIERTRRHRRDADLAARSESVAADLASAQLAHEVELVASESARDALLQTANLLTTIHAHLVAAGTILAPRGRSDPMLAQLLRNLDAARTTADAAVTAAEGFFNSAYAHRDSSPALVGPGIRHAIEIARRVTDAERDNKAVDFALQENQVVARGLSGIDFLLLMVPLVGAGLLRARPATTVRIEIGALTRLEAAFKDLGSGKTVLWLNRRHAVVSHPGLLVQISATAPAIDRETLEAWLKAEPSALAAVSARGLVSGLQKSHGALGVALAPGATSFRLALALPV